VCLYVYIYVHTRIYDIYFCGIFVCVRVSDKIEYEFEHARIQ